MSFFPVKQLGTLVAQATVTLQCEEPTESYDFRTLLFFALKRNSTSASLTRADPGPAKREAKLSWIFSYSCESTYGF